jgi:hypothetical protein
MKEIDIEKLVGDREAFGAFIYTPLREAMQELADRSCNGELSRKMNSLMLNGVPKILNDRESAVIFRQVATPNYETIKFLNILSVNQYLQPVFWEYYEDKFTSNNEYKRSLGKMSFHAGTGKKGGAKLNHHTIINFNLYNGKKISEVKTLWGESLIDFHHKLFPLIYPNKAVFFDASSWFRDSGGSAKDYYKSFLRLFVKNAILFEYFMLDDEEECEFTRKVFLPAFDEVLEETGYKPLIVPLVWSGKEKWSENEQDPVWMHYPLKAEERVKNNLLGI